MADLPGFRIIVHYMPGAVIRAVMVLHGLVGMGNRDIPICGVSGNLGCTEKEFEVHHVVDDDGALAIEFFARSPALDDAGSRFETGAEGLGGVHDDIVILFGALEAKSVAVASINHKPYVVMLREILDIAKDFSVFLGMLGPILVTCIFIHVPERSGQEA